MPCKVIGERELPPPVELRGRMMFYKPLKGVASIIGGEEG